MNATDFDKIVGDRMEWCFETLCKKGDEYARNGDRLWNFKVAARKRDCRPAQALAGMMVKHTVSVDDIIDGLANGIVPPREMVAEKIGDSINYLLLLEGLIEEERRVRAGSPVMDKLPASAPRVEVRNWHDRTSLAPLPEVCGGYVVCSGCGLKCSIGSEQEQSVNLTGRCTLCRAEKEREAYNLPLPQDGDDDHPAVVQVDLVSDRTSRSTMPEQCLGNLCGRFVGR